MSEQDDARERPTDPVSKAPPSEPGADTPQLPVPRNALPPVDAFAYFEDAKNSLLETARKIDSYRDELISPDGLLSQQTEKISAIVDKNYLLIHQEFLSFGKQLEALVERVKTTEVRLESGVERFESIEAEVAAIRCEMSAQRESFDKRLAELESNLQTLLSKNAAPEATESAIGQ